LKIVADDPTAVTIRRASDAVDRSRATMRRSRADREAISKRITKATEEPKIG
jgi:hypothetical protein